MVVVADLDADGAQAVAAEVGGIAMACDVPVETQVAELVCQTQEALGRVDLFCANGGRGGHRPHDAAGRPGLRVRRLRARRQGAAARLARTRRGLLSVHSIVGWPAHADRLGAIRGDEARDGCVRRVALGHVPRRTHELPVPDGRQTAMTAVPDGAPADQRLATGRVSHGRLLAAKAAARLDRGGASAMDEEQRSRGRPPRLDGASVGDALFRGRRAVAGSRAVRSGQRLTSTSMCGQQSARVVPCPD